MDQDLLKAIIYKVICKLKDCNLTAIHPQFIPIGVSNRHLHLSQTDLEILFGAGYKLKPTQDLSQPGQFSAAETVNIAGPKGCLEKVRIIGPTRKNTQIEIMRSDKYKLGINPEIKESGDLKNSVGITIIGPRGSVEIKEGLIIAKRHIHMTEKDALAFKVCDGEIVQVKAGRDRSLIFDAVVVRVSDKFKLEFHIDMDEANAAEVENGDMSGLLVAKNPYESLKDDIDFKSQTIERHQGKGTLSLITEESVRKAFKNKESLTVKKGYMITPLAKDVVKELGVEIISM